MLKWIAGARPRTLAAGVVPVCVGTAAVSGQEPLNFLRFGLAIAVALALQVGVNFANDYSDGKKGIDSELRKGPTRLVGSGQATQRAVLAAALLAFAAAAGFGSALGVLVGWELWVVGAVSFLAAWTYTGGPWPYGYHGLGEVGVFIFFGLVPTAGSAYVQTEMLDGLAVLLGAGVGFMSSALLAANNLRDFDSDKASHKRTLAAILGRKWFARLSGSFFVLASLVCLAAALFKVWALLGLIALLPVLRQRGFSQLSLKTASGALLAYGVGLSVGLWV